MSESRLPAAFEDGDVPPPLTGLSRTLDRTLSVPSAALAAAGALLLVAMMVVTVADVLYRVLFAGAIANAQLMTSHWFLSGTIFLPLAYVAVLDRHISVEVLSRFFPERVQEVMMGLFALVGAGIFLLLAVNSWELALKKMAIREYLSGVVPFYSWPGRFLMPVGTFFFALVLAARSVGYVAGRVRV